MKVVFVCVENSNRSQMAEAFGRLAGMEAYSAGSKPSGKVNPKAIASMQEVGYDMRGPISEFARKRREDWQIPDPKELPQDEFRNVRDLIAAKVRGACGDTVLRRCRSHRPTGPIGTGVSVRNRSFAGAFLQKKWPRSVRACRQMSSRHTQTVPSKVRVPDSRQATRNRGFDDTLSQRMRISDGKHG